jgi:hypothetical protein
MLAFCDYRLFYTTAAVKQHIALGRDAKTQKAISRSRNRCPGTSWRLQAHLHISGTPCESPFAASSIIRECKIHETLNGNLFAHFRPYGWPRERYLFSFIVTHVLILINLFSRAPHHVWSNIAQTTCRCGYIFILQPLSLCRDAGFWFCTFTLLSSLLIFTRFSFSVVH